ncbi:MAG: SusC/RagA family TonB-linked outer membrane protein [Bacteroidetes bacterium]|nr:SusC/RagA family TonB-linked outer membrane protein [Bacteroidota bacterium]
MILKMINRLVVRFLVIILITICANQAYAQNETMRKLYGQVTDMTDKNPMPGVSISIKGTQSGCTTDINGTYNISASKGDILVFSMIGYEKQEILVNNQAVLNVGLKVSVKSLDEVVVIGYGTTTKKEVTGAIATVKADEFNRGTFNNPIGLLQGKVAGLNIVKPDGADPQAGYNIILRGTNTLVAGQGPLIIIDGVAGADMRNVSPDEVESIDVLKDGSAAAIYGTRGSNGVIIITTKRARSGQSKVEYSGLVSVQVAPRGVRNLTADEFRNAINTYAPDKVSSIYDDNVNWFKEVTRPNPVSQQHNLAISGGNDNFSHRTTIFVDLSEGLLKNNQSDKFLVKTNINQKALEGLLTLDYNLSYGMRKYNPANYDVFYQAFIRNPTSPVYDPSNTTYGGYTYLPGANFYNPVAMINERTQDGKTNDAAGNVRATIKFAPTLNWVNFISYNLSDWESNDYKTQYYPSIIGKGGSASIDNGRSSDILYESTLNYSKTLGKHFLQALGGYSYEKNVYNDAYMGNSGFDFDDYGVNNIGAGAALAGGTAEMGSYKSQSLLISFFGRLIYNFDERFLASASIRREGSSRFGVNNKWGWFPSASLGWRINKEEFMKNVNLVNDLKLRVGFGVTGNQDFDNYQSLILMQRGLNSSFYYNGQWINTYRPKTNPNPNLRWEKKQELNAGIDFAILKSRITGAVDYYYRWSTDLLYTYSVPTGAMYSVNTLFTNVGSISNRGLEFTLNVVAVEKTKFKWNSTFTFSKNVNKLLKFSNAEFTATSMPVGWLGGSFPLNCQRLQEGEPLGTFYGPVWLGVDATGHDEFKNQNKVGQVSTEDWEPIGNANPKCMLGWSNTFTYANWDLNLSLRSQIGGKALNMYRLYYENWQSIGQNIVYTQIENPEFIGTGQYSSKYVENATFLKLDNVAVGYNFTGITRYISKLRFFASAQNVFCLTGYKGLDPEVNMSGLSPGIEYLSYYPRTTVISFGVNASF